MTKMSHNSVKMAKLKNHYVMYDKPKSVVCMLRVTCISMGERSEKLQKAEYSKKYFEPLTSHNSSKNKKKTRLYMISRTTFQKSKD